VKSEYVGLLISFKTKICDAFGCDSVTPNKNNTKQVIKMSEEGKKYTKIFKNFYRTTIFSKKL
jgi:hypothetical protein